MLILSYILLPNAFGYYIKCCGLAYVQTCSFLNFDFVRSPSHPHNLSCFLSGRQMQYKCLDVFYPTLCFPKPNCRIILTFTFFVSFLCSQSQFLLKKFKCRIVIRNKKVNFQSAFCIWFSAKKNHINLKTLKYHRRQKAFQMQD